MYLYCKDTQATLHSNLPHNKQNPFLIQFGDASVSIAPGALAESRRLRNVNRTLWTDPMVPHFKKFRQAWSGAELDHLTKPENCLGRQTLFRLNAVKTQIVQPLIWKLNIRRHYKKLNDVPCNDVPWSEKKSMAVFRGKLNGVINRGDQSHMGMNDKGTCLSIPRCMLVYSSRHSTSIDARLTDVRGRIGGSIEGYNLTAHSLSMRQLLRYKALIIVEGNDVSSGLKWALLSQSIVMMPPPRFTSWAMEEKLEPWIHYVPLDDDLSNVEGSLAWVLEHEAEAARIVRRSTLWILDLLYHPQALQEEQQVYREILLRYSRHFVRDDALESSIW
eukprot:CAMPEP_0198141278 /NCGR_PEP_ID=MMETSP1443-20131203/4320_1 /TAXON_ID=186043 /ORGANISM="Entomoneis sp., Strain CCMP2396" /LENGTH=331 /DNA_ID=CAMNT_0043803983 /DNA_START=306 /DNA_END=1298 /DNA_ORIENTATION=+